MARILITGGAGFIGSHLCERALGEGHEVVVIDDFSSGHAKNLESVSASIHLIHDDVRNVLAYADSLRGITHVVHLAALISGHDSLLEPQNYLDSNLFGMLEVLKLCQRLNRPRVVFASSSTVYGADGLRSVRSETEVPSPLSVYALSKLGGEHLLAMYAPLYDFEHVSLRLFNVYGPRQSPSHPYANVTCKFAHAAATGGGVVLYGDGLQSRDFVYVEDVVDVMMRVLSASRQTIYNVGTGRDTKIADLLEIVQNLAGRRLSVDQQPPWPNDIRCIRADVERLSAEFGAAPATSFGDGLRATIDWFQSQGGSAAG